MKILSVTYHFPPDKSVCGDRPYSLYKHARAAGIEMEILTVKNHGLLADEAGIFRFDSVTGWNKVLQPKKWLHKFMTKISEPFSANIDFHWMKTVLNSDQFSENRGYQAVYAIYPTYTDLLIAETLANRFNIPLVIDFTDSLYTEALEDNYGYWQTKHRLGLEKRLIEHAEFSLSVADRLTDHLKLKYPGNSIYTIYNGFEPDDFMGIDQLPRKSKDGFFRIAHFGNINQSRTRSVKPLWEALTLLENEGVIHPKNFELIFYGAATIEEKREVEEAGLSDLVHFQGHIQKKMGFQKLWQTCDALLSYGIPGHRFTVTSKLLEYFRLGIPILGICGGNEAEVLIQETGTGEVSGFLPEQIRDLFLKAINGKLNFNPNQNSIRRFDRRVQAQLIFKHLRNTLHL